MAYGSLISFFFIWELAFWPADQKVDLCKILQWRLQLHANLECYYSKYSKNQQSHAGLDLSTASNWDSGIYLIYILDFLHSILFKICMVNFSLRKPDNFPELELIFMLTLLQIHRNCIFKCFHVHFKYFRIMNNYFSWFQH